MKDRYTEKFENILADKYGIYWHNGMNEYYSCRHEGDIFGIETTLIGIMVIELTSKWIGSSVGDYCLDGCPDSEAIYNALKKECDEVWK